MVKKNLVIFSHAGLSCIFLCSGISQHNLLFCDICAIDVDTIGIILEIFQFRFPIGYTVSAHDSIFLLQPKFTDRFMSFKGK